MMDCLHRDKVCISRDTFFMGEHYGKSLKSLHKTSVSTEGRNLLSLGKLQILPFTNKLIHQHLRLFLVAFLGHLNGHRRY